MPARAYILATLIPALLASSMANGGQILSTGNHPLPSPLVADAFLGNPLNENNAPLATIGPGVLAGDGEFEIVTDGSGNGSLKIIGSQLILNDLAGTIDLETLGTLDYEFNDIGLSFRTFDAFPLTLAANAFSFLFDDTKMSLQINNGVARLFNPTGAMAILLGAGFDSGQDFGLNPYTAQGRFANPTTILGTAYSAGGPNTGGPEVNIEMPQIDALVFLLDDVIVGGEIWLRLAGEIHVAAVPEPSSGVLGTVAGLLFAGFMVRRRRQGSLSVH